MNAPRLGEVAHGSEPRSLEQRVQPPLEANVRHSAGRSDHVPLGLVFLAVRLDAGEILKSRVDDLALGRRHGLEWNRTAGGEDTVGGTFSGRDQSRAASLPIAARVDLHPFAVLSLCPMCDRGDDVLDGVDRPSIPADEKAEILRGRGRVHALIVLGHRDLAVRAELVRNSHDELLDELREWRLGAGWPRRDSLRCEAGCCDIEACQHSRR